MRSGGGYLSVAAYFLQLQQQAFFEQIGIAICKNIWHNSILEKCGKTQKSKMR